MQSFSIRLGALIAMLLMTIACSSRLPELTAARQRTQLLDQIEQANQEWQTKGINTYHLAGQYIAFGAQTTFEVTVKDGRIVQQSCQERRRPANWCSWNFTPNPYTVPQLFALARDEAGKSQQTDITFDKAFGFPEVIRVDYTSATDDEATWRVTAFEATPPPIPQKP